MPDSNSVSRIATRALDPSGLRLVWSKVRSAIEDARAKWSNETTVQYVKFEKITAIEYANKSEYDPNTLYFISSELESRIAIGSILYANYVPAHCTALELNYNSVTLGAGESIVLIATTEPANSSDPIIWEASSDEIIIESTQFHNRVKITGSTEGTFSVTCTCGEFTATCSIEVHEAYIYTDHILAENYTPNGAKFIYTAPISLTNGNYIEVSIDVSTVTGNKENILSIGENISVWSAANSGYRTHMYLTASSRTKVSIDLMHDTKSLRPTYTLSGTLLLLRLDEYGVWINGEHFLYDTDLRSTPTLTYEEGMAGLTSLLSYDIGSQEGSNRSHATYNYIKYVTTQYSE